VLQPVARINVRVSVDPTSTNTTHTHATTQAPAASGRSAPSSAAPAPPQPSHPPPAPQLLPPRRPRSHHRLWPARSTTPLHRARTGGCCLSWCRWRWLRSLRSEDASCGMLPCALKRALKYDELSFAALCSINVCPPAFILLRCHQHLLPFIYFAVTRSVSQSVSKPPVPSLRQLSLFHPMCAPCASHSTLWA